MKSAFFASFVLAAVLSVSALPQANKGTCQPGGVSDKPGTGKTVGALYFQSNHASANNIIIHNIHQDGTLSFAGGVSTQGVGSPGGLPGPDPLASQGCVVVSGEHLFAVNAGSNTVVMYSIDPKDPTKLTMVGKPVPSGGNFPVSAAVSPTNGDLCVVNTGMMNSVNCFSVDAKKGLSPRAKAIMPLNLNTTGQSAPPTPFNTVGHIIFSNDGNQILLAVRSGRTLTGGGIFSMDYNCDGTLGEIVHTPFPKGGGFPFSLWPINGRQDAYINSDSVSGYAVYDFSKGYGDAAVSQAYVVPKHNATCWTVFSKQSNTYYITDGGSGIVSEVAVDEQTLNATLVTQYQQQSGLDDEWLDSINGQDYLWILRSDKLIIDTLRIGEPGKAKTVQSLSFNASATSAHLPVGTQYVQGLASYIIKA